MYPLKNDNDNGGLPILPPKQKQKSTSGGLPILKKKESTQSVSSSNGGLPSQTIDHDDPVKSIVEPFEQIATEAGKKYDLNTNEFFKSGESTYMKGLAPVKMMGEQLGNEFNKQKSDFESSVKNLHSVTKFVNEKTFPNGVEAKRYIKQKIEKNGKLSPNNYTEKIAIQKANDYDELEHTLNNIQDKYSPNGFVPQNPIILAAIDEEKRNNPNFAEKISQTGLNNSGYENMPNVTEGRIVANYIVSHQGDLEAYAKAHPEWNNLYEDTKEKLLDLYPDFGINLVANKLSRERQARGMNNSWANFDTKSFHTNTDKLAAEILSPKEKEIYDNVVGKDLKKYIDAPGLVNRFEASVEKTAKGMFSSLEDLVTFGQPSDKENAMNSLEKQDTQIHAGEKGWSETLSTLGDFGGMVATMAAPGGVLKGLNINPAIADKMISISTFLDQELKNGYDKFPKEKWKAVLSGLTNTAFYSALSDIYPAGKVSEALSGVKKDIASAIENLSADASQQTVKEAIVSAVQKVGAQYFKGIGEMAALNTISKTLDKALGMDDKTMAHFHPENELSDVVKTMAIGGFIPSVIIGHGRFAEVSYAKEMPYEIASQPKRFLSQLDNLPEEQRAKIEETIKYLADTKATLDENNIPEKQQKQYLFEANKEKALIEKLKTITNPTAQTKLKEQIKNAQEIQDKILGGDKSDEVISDAEQKKIDEEKDTQLKLERLKKDNELDNEKLDAQREKLDGRVPDDRLKIKEVEEKKKRTDEDYQIAVEKLSPKKEEKPESSSTSVITGNEVALKDKVFYHGTKKEFDEFNESNQGATDEGWYGKGFYFHSDKDGGGYGDIIKSAKLDLNNPIELPVNNSGQYLYDIVGEKAGLDKSFRDKSSMAIVKEIGADKFSKIAKELGYDGVVVNYSEGTKEVVVFDKNKIKVQPESQSSPTSVITPEEVGDKEFEGFKNHILETIKNVKDNSFDFRISSSLDYKTREQAIRNIKEGKDTKAAQTLLAEIKQMYDDGYVRMNTAAGGLSKTIGIPLKEYMAEINKDHEPLTDDEIMQLNFDLTEDSFKFDNNGQEGLHKETQPTSAREATTSSQEPIETESDSRISAKTQQEEIAPPTSEPPPSGSGGGEEMRLTHSDTEKIYQESGLPERLETPTKHKEQLEAEAGEVLAKGYDFNKVADETMSGQRKWEDTDQILFARKVTDLKKKQQGLSIQSEEFTNLQNEIEKFSRASDVAGTIGGRFLQSRKDYVPLEETLSDYVIKEKEAAQVSDLTEQQKTTVEKEFNDIFKAEKAYQEKIAALEAENAKLKADKEVGKAKSTTKKQAKKSHEDYVKERQQIIDHLKEQLKKSRGETSATILPYAKELVAIAPDVAKLVKSLVEEGVTKLADIIKEVHPIVKEAIPDATEKDIHDIIAGEYNEKKPERKELAKKLFELKTQAQLINKLEKLYAGEEPKSEKKKVQRNQEIEKIRSQIKDIQSFDADVKKQKELSEKQKADQAKSTEKQLGVAEKELDKKDKDEVSKSELEEKMMAKEAAFRTPEEKALDSFKSRTSKQIQKVEEDLRNGNFAPPEKKEPLKLDAEGKKLQSKLIKLKQDRETRLLKQQYENRSRFERARDWTIDKLNIPRTVMASMDFSAPLRQGIIASVSHPRTAALAGVRMFEAAFSQKNFDRWFFEIKENPRYETAQKSGLSLSDPHSPFLTAKEEAFMNNTAEKIPLIGKLIKGSERAYVMYLNKMRWDLFNRFADRFEEMGMTVENSPEFYKQLGGYINNQTGRGGMGKLENYAPMLNTVFFAPRLIASRINLLNPLYYARLPKPLRIMAAKDMFKFIGLGLSVLALAKLNGAEVEDDPRSSDFGKIKSGNTRWDVWGGFQQYIRMFTQLISGERKSAATGDIYTLDGSGAFGANRGDVVTSFFRGKLAPVPSMAADFISGRNAAGQNVTPLNEAESHFLPLLYSDIKSAAQEKGISALFTVGIPATFGVGTQTYDPSKIKPIKTKQTNKAKTNKEAMKK